MIGVIQFVDTRSQHAPSTVIYGTVICQKTSDLCYKTSPIIEYPLAESNLAVDNVLLVGGWYAYPSEKYAISIPNVWQYMGKTCFKPPTSLFSSMSFPAFSTSVGTIVQKFPSHLRPSAPLTHSHIEYISDTIYTHGYTWLYIHSYTMLYTYSWL